MSEKRISSEKIKKFLNKLFLSVGYPQIQAKQISESLVLASLRGVDSHGIRLAVHYAKAAEAGRINTRPKLKLKKTAPGTGFVNADHSQGIVAGIFAMKSAIEMAKKTGIGAVAVSNSTHFAAAATYSLIAAKNNMIGISFTQSESLVAPFGGRTAFLGTNPICFTAPCAGEEPFCLDMATSAITRNKVLHYKELNKKLEPGWVIDKFGKVTIYPEKAAALFPFGGYKGYGLGLMIEILCSLLSGMAFGPAVNPMLPVSSKKRKLGHFFIAIDIKRFESVTVFKKRLKKLLDELRDSKPAKGFKKVMVPGDPEKNEYEIRLKKGIPVPDEIMKKFNLLAEKYKISKI